MSHNIVECLNSSWHCALLGSNPTNACERTICKYINPKVWLTFIQLAGTAPEANLRTTQMRKHTRDPIWLWNPEETHQKSKTGVSVVPQKDLCPPINIKKYQTILELVTKTIFVIESVYFRNSMVSQTQLTHQLNCMISNCPLPEMKECCQQRLLEPKLENRLGWFLLLKQKTKKKW